MCVEVSFSNSFRLLIKHMKEHRMRQGNKKIYHLEAWVIKVMSLYKVRPHLPRVAGIRLISSRHSTSFSILIWRTSKNLPLFCVVMSVF